MIELNWEELLMLISDSAGNNYIGVFTHKSGTEEIVITEKAAILGTFDMSYPIERNKVLPSIKKELLNNLSLIDIDANHVDESIVAVNDDFLTIRNSTKESFILLDRRIDDDLFDLMARICKAIKEMAKSKKEKIVSVVEDKIILKKAKGKITIRSDE